MRMANKNKVTAALLSAVIFSLGLTGCAENQIRDIADEEVQAAAEYVAVTLMKYDMGHRSRLMDLSQYGEPDQSPEQPGQEQAGTQGTEKEPVDNTPVVDASGKENSDMVSSLEAALDFPEGLTIGYVGEKVCDYYPEDDEGLFFSLNATEGKRLLVLRFSIANSTQEERSLDLLSLDISFKITVNGEYTCRALTTLMDEDLATYRNVLPAGGSGEAVLVIEVAENLAENLSSISLDVKNDTKSYKLKLL